ncbi:Uncharacterised protein [Mycobacterium tuberculosis]|nr:Uncharacterised protein [Mycobacterium tuberculosis]
MKLIAAATSSRPWATLVAGTSLPMRSIHTASRSP